MMLRCAPPSAVTRQVARPAPARIAAAAGRVAGAPCVSAKHGIVAPRRCLHRRLCCVRGSGRARAAVDLQSSAAPPLALLAGVTRHCLEVDYGGRKIKIETGEIARQANGAVTLTDGETIVLATACADPAPADSGGGSSQQQQHGRDGSYVPLQVNYSERFSAAGRTTGSFFKRDGRPKDSETLVARLVDRPLRPNFDKGWSAETQVLIWVVSYDGEHSPEPLAITAAGAALAVSDIPLAKAVVGARVALLPSDYDFSREDAADGDDGNAKTSRRESPCGGWLVANPTVLQAASSELDLVLAGTSTAVMMIEGYCSFLKDEVMVAAVELGAAAVAATAAAVDAWALEVRRGSGLEKRTDRVLPDPSLFDSVAAFAAAPLAEAFGSGKSKDELSASVAEIRRRAAAAVGLADASAAPAAGVSGGDGSGDRASSAAAAASSASASTASSDGDEDEGRRGVVRFSEAAFNAAFKKVTSASMRSAVLDSGLRSDGRAAGEVRPIAARAGLLPRAHGSALFTRGETQALAVTTLGAASSAQRVDSMTIAAATGSIGGDASTDASFYLQYFFPPSSVGETGRVGAPGRREVGHGALAERALAPVVPDRDAFPYTVRVESTITESNGSSSMASVCGGCLSMLDAGVPIKAVVAGVAMGLILEEKAGGEDAVPPRFQILTDILGSEDALGDMDFKVAGDADRVTAFQMDVKVDGITPAIISAALSAARDARRVVLAAMEACSPSPRRALGPRSPRIELVRVPSDKLGQIIGPGGKTIRGIREASGCESVNVLQDSEASSTDGTALVELCDVSPEAVASARALVLAIAVDPLPGAQFPGSRVNSVERFGLIVEFVPGRSGLAHVSELPFDRSDPEAYEVGDRVDVVLLEGENGRYKLSLRAFPGSGGGNGGGGDRGGGDRGGDDQWERRGGGGGGRRGGEDNSSWAESSSSSSGSYSSARSNNNRRFDAAPPPRAAPLQPVEEGAVFRGAVVRGVQPFGVFADLGGGRSGMIHVSELREPRPADPSERYQRGDRVDVVVLSAAEGRIGLSEKRVEGAGRGKSDGVDGGDSDDSVGGAPRTPRQLAEETSRRLGLDDDSDDDDDDDDFDPSDFA